MCGRFALDTDWVELVDAFDLVRSNAAPRIEPRFNIAPTQPILIVRPAYDDARKGRETGFARWGLIPSWVKDPNDFPTIINARAETAAEKPSFRAAMKHGRVLVPASGFYEWQSKGKGEPKQPFFVRPRAGGLVAFGGLAERWQGPNGEETVSAAIVTTGPNGTFGALHDRMPLVVPSAACDAWLDARRTHPEEVAELLVPPADDFWEAVPVARAVGNPRAQGPGLIERVEGVEAPF